MSLNQNSSKLKDFVQAFGPQLSILNYSQTCLKQAAKGNTKIACLRQVLA